jgi:hypothetical protein
MLRKEGKTNLRMWIGVSAILLIANAIAFTIVQTLIEPRYLAWLTDDFSHVDPLTQHYFIVSKVMTYELGWVVVGFVWFAAVFYAIAFALVSWGASKTKRYAPMTDYDSLQMYVSWRWAAFALIAAVANWITASLAGVSNMILLFLLSTTTIIAVICVGPMHDETASDQGEKKSSRTTMMIWRSFSVGVVLFVIHITIILQYMIEAATTGPLHWTFYLAVIGALVWSAAIGVMQGMKQSSANGEKITTVLTVVLVLWITWLFFGITEAVH